jgi:hypothetical protein
MSNWPKKYKCTIDYSSGMVAMEEHDLGMYVFENDFEKLLELAAHEIYHSGMSHDKNPEEVKVRLLKQLGERK